MAHAGTIDLGRQAKPSSSRNPWLGVATFVALAAIAVMYFVSAPGLTSGNLAAKPAADRSYDQVEAQRGVVARPVDNGYDQIEKLRITGAASAAAAEPWSPGKYDVATLPIPAAAERFSLGQFDGAKVPVAGAKLSAATVEPWSPGKYDVAISPATVTADRWSLGQSDGAKLPAAGAKLSAAAAAPIKPLVDRKAIDIQAKQDRIGGF